MKKWMILVIGLVVVGLIIGIIFISSYLRERAQMRGVIAIVNGVEITKDEFVQRLIQSAGEPVLEQMIIEILVEQKAKEQKVKVETEEIDAKIDEVKGRFPSEEAFVQQLAASGMTIEGLRQQFESQILIEKLILKEEATLTQQEIWTKSSTFLEDLKKEAKIEIMLPELRKVVAVVNGEEITKDEFVQRLSSLTSKPVLEQMIIEILVEQKAKEQKVKVETEEIDAKIDEVKGRFPSEEGFVQFAEQSGRTIEGLRQQFESQILIEKLVLKESVATEEEIKDYFEKNKDKFDKPDQVRASHILVETEEEAKEILRQLRVGADFAELAQENSIDPATKDKGGDIGFFSRGKMTPAFEEAAFALEIGGISDVVKTPYGYHIIRLEEKKPAQKATFELVREEINKTLTQQKAWTKRSTFLEDLKKEAKIEIMLPELRD